MTVDLQALLCCPRCRSALDLSDSMRPVCTNRACVYSERGFPVAAGQPVLVDFERSIFQQAAYEDGRGSVVPRDDSGRGWRVRLRRFITGDNRVAMGGAQALAERVKALAPRPTVLVIGGGALGRGTAPLYQDPAIDVVGTDVYASPYTKVVADGHQLPFRDGVFQGVWIQAVLEHVLEPTVVVDEIHRVLAPGGVVYADTPFMQQVHEGAYDFTRFTPSGHRWLFRRFDQIDAGTVGGAGTAATWSLRYLWRALGVGNHWATLLVLPFFWLRFLDRLTQRGPNADGAAGVYFLGAKSDKALEPKDMVAYYDAQR